MREYNRASAQEFARQEIEEQSEGVHLGEGKYFKVDPEADTKIDPAEEQEILGLIASSDRSFHSEAMQRLINQPKSRKVCAAIVAHPINYPDFNTGPYRDRISVAALEEAVLTDDRQTAQNAIDWYLYNLRDKFQRVEDYEIAGYLSQEPRFQYFVNYFIDQLNSSDQRALDIVNNFIQDLWERVPEGIGVSELFRRLPIASLKKMFNLRTQEAKDDHLALEKLRTELGLAEQIQDVEMFEQRSNLAVVALKVLNQDYWATPFHHAEDEAKYSAAFEQNLADCRPELMIDAQKASLLYSLKGTGKFENEQEVREFLQLEGDGFIDVLHLAIEEAPAFETKLDLALFYESENMFNAPEAFRAAGLSRDVWPIEVRQYVDYISKQPDTRIDQAALCARRTHGLSPVEYTQISQTRPEALELSSETGVDSEALFEALKTTIDDENIIEQMSAFQNAFGAKVALQYSNRRDLSRHDAFYISNEIIAAQVGSQLSSDAFARQVLMQVAQDNAVYHVGTSHHRFNGIVTNLAFVDYKDVIAKAKGYSSLEQFQEFINQIAEQKDVYASWKVLKQFDDVRALLQRSEVLDQLKAEPSKRMRDYISRLAFHPNINTEAVVTFWRQPADFLEIDDAHTNDRINAVKKPANYLSLPYLGLKAEDLRDALVEGSLDRIQTMPSMEREYHLYASEELDPARPENLFQAMRRAIGQERKGVPGEAKQVKKIFGQVRSFCKKHKINWRELWNASETVAAMSDDQRQELQQIIFDRVYGIPEPKHEVYRVRIGKKSDPEMVVAGNDTSSCMPFGSGKNNVYMFNPNCVQLVCERLTGENEWRTATQSVVTIDIQTSRLTPDVIAAYQAEIGHLKDLLHDEDFQRPGVLTCDNIEVAKNSEGDAANYIRRVYTKFFTEYLKNHAKEQNLDPAKVIAGTGYTPARLGFESVDNRYIPLAPMGYSDNVHAKAFQIETGLVDSGQEVRTGVSQMQTRDVLAVAVLEGKAYSDNLSLLENLHGMQNNIIGMEIANEHLDRPNLSFVYRDQTGVPRGYILAYEGRNGDVPEVYLSDLAADPKSRLAGGRLIQTFFETYTTNYGTAEKPFLPIFTNAREQTSYRIIQRQIDRLAQRAGLQTELEVVNTYQRGGDTFYDVRIYIGHSVEEIATQKAQY